jgi:heme/copper-type cytochrome/quinol oxidase subunit 2
LLPIPMELAPPVSGVVFICIFWTAIVLFIVRFVLLYSFRLSYARLVVRTWRD